MSLSDDGDEEIDPLALEINDEPVEYSEASSRRWENEAASHSQVKYKIFKGHHRAVNSCQFCVEDSRILTASSDQTSALWNVETGEILHKYEGHSDVISQCHMNNDATRFVSGSWDKRVNLWSTDTGQTLSYRRMYVMRRAVFNNLYRWSAVLGGIVTCCQISHSGKYVAAGSDLDSALTVWDASNGKLLCQIKNHHKSTLTSLKFSPNDDRICTTSMDGTTKLFDLCTRTVTLEIGGHINVVSCCCFDKDERNLCTGSWDKHLNIWDVSAGTFRNKGPLTLSKGHEGCISSCVYSSDGDMLASGSYDCTVVVWDMKTQSPKLTLKGHEDWVTDVDFSQDSKTVLSCSKDKTLRLWNISVSDGKPVVLESKRSMGLRIVKCKDCKKPFSISQSDDVITAQLCVFCRLQASRNLPSFREEGLFELPG